MSTSPVVHHQPHRRHLALALFLLFGGVAALSPLTLRLIGMTTDARIADAETLGVNRLGAARAEITVTLPDTGSTAFTSLGAENLAPGDVVVGSLDIANTGTLPLVYSLSATALSGGLHPWVRLVIWPALSNPNNSNPSGPRPEGRSCPAEPPPGMTAIALQPASSTGDRVRLLGDPATGRQPGDRTLTPGQTDHLCVAATVALTAPNTAQRSAIRFDLIVDAEHDLRADTEGAGS